MIPKGNQRAGGQQLATHLLNAYDNDRVEVAEVRGSVAQDLHGAFAEWYALAKATQCSKYLYSLSINPDHAQGPYTRAHYDDFIRRTEEKLGLAGQPRAVVFHVKYGREHCHVVWSRIDVDKMKAVQLSHDRQKLRKVAQEYAKQHNLTLPPGMRKDRGLERFNEHAKGENLAEKQQQERTGISKQERMERIGKAWRESADAGTFVKALADTGYILARGDRRAYVVVDLAGEIHSLSRQLAGVKGKDIKARLAAYAIDKLPTVEAAQDRAREKRQALLLEARKETTRHDKPGHAPDAPSQRQPTAKERRETLRQAQDKRRAELDAKRQQLAERHSAERKALSDLQNVRSASIARDRAAKQPQGLLAFLSRITGFSALTAFRHNWQDRKREQEYRAQSAALARRHGREMEDFRHRERGLTSLEKRERRSLETALRREAFRAVALPAPQKTPTLTPAQRARAETAKQLAGEFRKAASPRPGGDAIQLTPEQRAKIAEFKRAAGEMAASGGEQRGQRKQQGGVSAKFNEKAEKPVPARNQETGKSGDKKQAPLPRETTDAGKAGVSRQQDIRENAREQTRDLTDAERRALELAEEFRRRAGQTGGGKERDREGHGRGGSREKHYRTPPPDFSKRR